MNETTKESKFLDAINQYAEKQKSIISREVEEYKSQKIEQATEAGLKDAYELIQRDIARRKSDIVTEYAQKEYALRRDLYAERQRIMDEVFAQAQDKLIAYTRSDAYRAGLKDTLQEAAALCGESPCVVCLKKDDLSLGDGLTALFGSAEVQEDQTILIGGAKVLCAEKGVLLDCTLDAKLEAERRLFTQSSGLKVV